MRLQIYLPHKRGELKGAGEEEEEDDGDGREFNFV